MANDVDCALDFVENDALLQHIDLSTYGVTMFISTIFGCAINVVMIIFSICAACKQHNFHAIAQSEEKTNTHISDKKPSAPAYKRLSMQLCMEYTMLILQDIIVGFVALEAANAVGLVSNAWVLSTVLNSVVLMVHSIRNCVVLYGELEEMNGCFICCLGTFPCIQFVIGIVLLTLCLIANTGIQDSRFIVTLMDGRVSDDRIDSGQFDSYELFSGETTESEYKGDGESNVHPRSNMACVIRFYDADGDELEWIDYSRGEKAAYSRCLCRQSGYMSLGEFVTIDNGECEFLPEYTVCYGVCVMND